MKVSITIGSLLLLGASTSFGATIVPVCERTAPVAEFLVNQVNLQQTAQKTCADITPEDLLTIERVAVQRKGITEFKPGDFSGLTNMKILNIRSNPYTALIEGLFEGLDSLETLVIIDTQLRHYPDDYLAHTPKLKNIHVFRNQVKTISESVFKRLEALQGLEVLDVDADLAPAELDRLHALYDNTAVQLILN